MNISYDRVQMEEHARKAARFQEPETTPWWVEPLIGGIVAVIVWLLCVGC